ncbi:MAG: NAD(P)-binding domain-containing protein [Sandaracinaceae bacterium]|nr:NAD(P)-binding domain-containing protein [Sandaracinaceae bacterium]
MKIAVLGTAIVGKTLAEKLSALGHDVMIGTRDPAASRARTAPDTFGGPPLSAFLTEHPRVALGTLAEAARHGELVINATSGAGAVEAIQQAGPANLEGKVLIDISNPLDFSRGMPPSLTVCNDDSLGEQVQRAAPGAKVVKTLNTVNAYLMVAPGILAGGDHTMFVCGDDAAAKATVTGLLREWFGWRDVIDLGGISMSRGTEMYLPLWARLYGALQNPMFTIKVVR